MRTETINAYQAKLDAAAKAADALAAADASFRAAHIAANAAYSPDYYEAYSKYTAYIDGVLPAR